MLLRSARRRRPRLIVSLVLIVAGAGLAIAYSGREQIEEVVAPPAANATPLATAIAVTPDERAFYEYVGARLRAMIAEADILIAMGNERSRDVVELQIRSDRVIALADDIDAYLAANPVPTRFLPAMQTYRPGSAQLRTGIGDAQSAFLAFDWDGVAAGLDIFSSGVDQLSVAFGEMRSVVTGPATPAAVTTYQAKRAG